MDFFAVLVALAVALVLVEVGAVNFFSWVSFTLITGEEKVKFAAERKSHSRFASSRMLSVAMVCSWPSAPITEMEAWKGASLNPYTHRATSLRIARS